VLFAAAGLAVLGVVWASTAVRTLRARHRELWHALHLLGYPAVALVVPHQVLTGSDFLVHPLLTPVWLATWCAVVVLAAWERVVRPARLARRHPLIVITVTREGPETVSLVLRSPTPLPEVEPGGFVLLGPDLWRRHPFSVVQRLDERTLRCTVEAVGDFTRRLVSLQPGDRLVLTGVHGRFTARNATTDGPYLLIGAGLGMTAVRGLLDGLLEQRPAADIAVVYRVRDNEQVLYADELAAARRRGVDLRVLAGSRDAPGVRACTAQEFTALVPDAAWREWFVCGPEGYMSVVRRAARRLGVPRARLHAERFTLGR
jgi:ferredoxin-NADP reductase